MPTPDGWLLDWPREGMLSPHREKMTTLTWKPEHGLNQARCVARGREISIQ